MRAAAMNAARTARNSIRALNPEIKSGNFLNNILGMREAIAAGAFEALMLNQDGHLAEATQSNVFVVRAIARWRSLRAVMSMIGRPTASSARAATNTHVGNPS